MWYPEEETQNIVFSPKEGQYLGNIYSLLSLPALPDCNFRASILLSPNASPWRPKSALHLAGSAS